MLPGLVLLPLPDGLVVLVPESFRGLVVPLVPVVEPLPLRPTQGSVDAWLLLLVWPVPWACDVVDVPVVELVPLLLVPLLLVVLPLLLRVLVPSRDVVVPDVPRVDDDPLRLLLFCPFSAVCPLMHGCCVVLCEPEVVGELVVGVWLCELLVELDWAAPVTAIAAANANAVVIVNM